FGWTGLAGAAMLAAAAAPWCAAPMLDASTRALHQRAQLAKAAAAQSAVRDARLVSDAQLLEPLPEWFPPFAQSSDDVAAILAQAHT
ncbi:hypothetical protein ACPWSM_25360, partial [Pandoraea pneumonica]